MGEIAEGLINSDFDFFTGEYIGRGGGFPRSYRGNVWERRRNSPNYKKNPRRGVMNYIQLQYSESDGDKTDKLLLKAFIPAAEFGYSLASKVAPDNRVRELEEENTRLKGLIEKAFVAGEQYNEEKKKPSFTGFLDGYTGIYGYKKFAKQNNLQ